MIESIPARRRRGAQPGNKNAKGNRGNHCPRSNFGNRGGKGAPIGNQYARKRPRCLQAVLLADYQHNQEACEWIEANRDVLASLTVGGTRTDPVDIAKYLHLSPEVIAEHGREFEFGLFVPAGSAEQDIQNAA